MEIFLNFSLYNFSAAKLKLARNCPVLIAQVDSRHLVYILKAIKRFLMKDSLA